MDRREFVYASLSALVAQPLKQSRAALAQTPLLTPADVSNYQSFFTLGELQHRVRRLNDAYPHLIRRRPIGISRYGEPIELVTLIGGRRSALLVAGVHANEPIGTLAIDLLLHRLTAHDKLRRQLDTTWHFINPIDPDGMRLTEASFKVPLTFRQHLRYFYRPAFIDQADYTFPIHIGDYSFDKPTPENKAWQQALDLTRPDFQYALHNSDIDGAVFLTSRESSVLDEQYLQLPAIFGVPLAADSGEGSARRPGLGGLLTDEEVIKRPGWYTGGCSTAYADKFGTYSLVPEVPLWMESPRLMEKLEAEQAKAFAESARIVERWAPKFEPTGGPNDLLVRAVQEALSFQRQKASGPAAFVKTAHGPSVLYFRAPAMLARVARSQQDNPYAAQAEREAQAFIDAQLAARAAAPIVPFPLRSTVGLLSVVALVTVDAFAKDRVENPGKFASPGRSED